MNDLYNAQDVILLDEIAENRFQYMHELYMVLTLEGVVLLAH